MNEVTPSVDRAAQVAIARNPTNPQAEVTRTLAIQSGVKLSGWIGNPRTFWREHSTQVWGFVAVLDLVLQFAQQDIPSEWTRVGHWITSAGAVTGMILKYRVQAGLVLERIRMAIRGRTDDDCDRAGT